MATRLWTNVDTFKKYIKRTPERMWTREAVEFLLENIGRGDSSLDIDIKTSIGDTALFGLCTHARAFFEDYRLTNQHFRTIQRFLELGADPNTINYRGRSPLCQAVIQLTVSMDKLTYEIYKRRHSIGVPPSLASETVRDRLVRRVSVDHLADREITDRALNTFEKHVVNLFKIIELLISRGVNVNTVDVYGKTPLFYAVEQCYSPRLVNMLINAGADKNIRNQDGDTVLDILDNYMQEIGQEPTRDRIQTIKDIIMRETSDEDPTQAGGIYAKSNNKKSNKKSNKSYNDKKYKRKTNKNLIKVYRKRSIKNKSKRIH
jgi:ankyrin repeat protein